MAVRTLGRGRVLQAGRRVPVVATVHCALLHQLPFGFLLPPPLLLPQQLLGLQEDSCVDGTAARVAVSGALVTGVAGVVLGRLEDLTRWVSLIPRVLRDGAGVFPGLTRLEKGNRCILLRLVVAIYDFYDTYFYMSRVCENVEAIVAFQTAHIY